MSLVPREALRCRPGLLKRDRRNVKVQAVDPAAFSDDFAVVEEVALVGVNVGNQVGSERNHAEQTDHGGVAELGARTPAR